LDRDDGAWVRGRDGTDQGNVTLTITGTGGGVPHFVTGATVKIVNQATAAQVSLSNVTVSNDNLITATLDSSQAYGGTWDVVVTNGNGQSNANTAADDLVIVNKSVSTSSVITISDVSYGSYPYYGNISWSETSSPGTTSVLIEMRAGNIATPDGTWTAWTQFNSGDSVATFNGKRFVQYRTTLRSTNINQVSALNDISITSGGPFVLTSSPYNTLSANNTLNSIVWTESKPGNSDVVFQIRTSPDNSTWTNWIGPDGTSNSVFTDPSGGEGMPASVKDGSNDQWIQYKVYLLTDLSNKSQVSDVTMNYNAMVPVVSSYAISDNTGDPHKFYDINYTPNNGYNNMTLTINGSDFVAGATVKLIKGGTNVTATNSSLTSTQIVCTFNTSNTPAGNWDLVVTNPNGASATQTSGLQSVQTVPTISSIATTGNDGNATHLDGTDQGSVTVTVNGVASIPNFIAGATVKIVNQATAAQVNLSNVNWVNTNQITATLDSSQTYGGTWDLVVSNVNGATNANTSTDDLIVDNKGVSTSPVLDLTSARDFSTITWTDSTPAGTWTTLEIRAGNVLSPDGTWTSWATIPSKNYDLGTSIDGRRFVQYRETLRSTNINNVPNFQDVTLSYVYYPTGSFQLLGSPYNAVSPGNILATLKWGEDALSGTDVKFQIRTAPDNGSGAPNWAGGSKWCGPTSCAATAGDTDYASSYYNTTPAGENINSTQADGSGDQWVQYSVWLDTNNSGLTPVLHNMEVDYAVNNSPVVDVPTVNIDTSTTPMRLGINYTTHDQDSDAPNYNHHTIYYEADLGVTFTDSPLAVGASTINLAGNYSYLPTGPQTVQIENELIYCTSRTISAPYQLQGCSRGMNNTTAVSHSQSGSNKVWYVATNSANKTGDGQVTMTGSAPNYIYSGSGTWTIKNDLPNIYYTSAIIQVVANDGNTALQVGKNQSASFTLDTNNPTSPTIFLDRSTSAGNISAKIGLTGTDAGDSLSYVVDNTQLYNVNDNCAGTSCACFGGAQTPADIESFVTAHFLSWHSLDSNPKTFTFTDNNDDARKVCVVYKDQYNNYSTNNENLCNGTTCNYAVTPQNPYAFKYYDTSNPQTSDYRLVLSWGIPALYGEGKENTFNGFDKYQIYRCHDSKNNNPCTNFTLYQSNAKSDNYITDSGLSNSDKYCYKYKIKDHPTDGTGNSSDYSQWSETLCAVPGAGGSSLSKNISIHSTSVPDETKYATQVTIDWDTYDAQDPNTLLTGTSAVYWRIPGTETWNYYSPSGYSEHHSVTIPGGQLIPDTTYEYKVYSQSLWNTEVYYQPISPYDTFHTLAGPAISNVQATDIGNSSATITWDTDISSSSELYYSTSYANGQLVSPDTGTCPGGYATAHTCTISGRNPGTTYYFSVKSVKNGDANAFAVQNYDITGAFLHFTTTVDYTLPVITPDTNPLILTDTQAALGWSTDKKTSSWILWGTETHTEGYTPPIANFNPNNSSHNPYQHYQANSNADLSHTFVMSLGSLTPDTDYFYRMASQDTSGNVTVSGESTFHTLKTQISQHDPLSYISTPVSANDGDTGDITREDSFAYVHWTTDQVANQRVECSLISGGPYTEESVEDLAHYNKSHVLKISGLSVSTKYYCQAISTDDLPSPTTKTSDEFSFTTLYSQESHVPLTDPGDPTTDGQLITTDTTEMIKEPTDSHSFANLCYSNSQISDADFTTCLNGDSNDNLHLIVDNTHTLNHYFQLGAGDTPDNPALTPNTTYYYRIQTIDSEDSDVVFLSSDSADIKFTTKQIQVDHISLSQATHDTDPTIVQYSDAEADVIFDAGTSSDSKLCYSENNNINISTCTGETPAVTNSRIHIYHLPGLTPDTKYYVKMKLTDSNDNTDTYATGEVNFTTEKIQVDQHAPLASISTPVSANDSDSSDITRGDTHAFIYWTTDQIANQHIGCSTTPGSYTEKTMEDLTNYNKSHMLEISNLSVNTKYYCKVTSTDDIGSPTQTSGEFSFTTLKTQVDQHDPLSTISTPASANGSDSADITRGDTSAHIYWTTDQPANQHIGCSTTPGSYTDKTKEDLTNYNKSHMLEISNLSVDTKYYCKVTSTDDIGSPTQTSGEFSFTTLKTQVDQHDPLSTISTPGSDDVTTSWNYAYVKWTTDQIANSTLECGTVHAGPYNLTTSDATGYGKAHALKMDGLDPDTDYFCKVISTDDLPSPTTLTSSEFTFKTDKNPEFQHPALTSISNISDPPTVLTDTTAVISFNTDQPSKCSIEYRVDGQNYPGEIASEDNYNQDHAIHLTAGIIFSTKYWYRISCEDNLNNVVTTQNPEEYSFTTKEQQSSHPVLTVIGDLTVPQYSDTEALVTLPPVNTESYSKLCYDTQPIMDMNSCAHHQDIDSTNTPNGTKTHYYHLTGLDASTHYYLEIKVVDTNDSNTNFTATKEFDTTKTPIEHIPLTDPGNPGALQVSDTEATITLPAKTGDSEVSTNSTATSRLCWGVAEIADVSNCVNHQEILSPTRLHYYHLTGLTPKTTYHIKTKAIDELDVDDNFTSEDVTFTTSDTLYTAIGWGDQGDKTPPVISNVSVGTITGESATITWDTDEKSSSNVFYGITSGTYEGSGADSLINIDPTKYDTKHTVILNGLVPGTKYYYIASSADAIGNIGKSPEQNLTTKSTSSLSSIKIASTKMGEALITWTTSQKTTSLVDYGVDNTYGLNKGDTTSATTHSIDITGLTQNTEYHFRVSGKDANNNIYSSGDLTFTPKSPPQLTNVKTGSTTEHEATIVFTSNVPTDALITYTNIKDSKDTGSQGNPSLLTDHSVMLKNLIPGATYSYSITAKDYDSNSATYPAQGIVAPTFITGVDNVPPKIDQVRTDSALAQNDKVQSIISWITDEPATTQIDYQEGKNGEVKEMTFGNSQYTQNHVAVITSFKPGVVYFFKVKSTDQSNNSATSSDFALLTPKQKENIIQIIISNFMDIFSWAKLGG